MIGLYGFSLIATSITDGGVPVKKGDLIIPHIFCSDQNYSFSSGDHGSRPQKGLIKLEL